MENQAINRALYRYIPKLWVRYWSARLSATVWCADRWLHAGNPEFTRWQKTKRQMLTVLLMLNPGENRITVRVDWKGGVSRRDDHA